MVRPNQLVNLDTERKQATFLMFARSDGTVKRRTLLINFPSKIIDITLGGKTPSDFVSDVTKVTEGKVNRYAVTIDLNEI